MPKALSVAPKERINIRFKPDINSAEEKELPLKLLMMGNYTGMRESTLIQERKPIRIDKDNFNEVLKAHNISLPLSVKNRLAENNDEIPIELAFESLRDFDPDRIAVQIPALNKLLLVRQALIALKGPLGNAPDFRKKLQGILNDKSTLEKLCQEINL